MCYLLSYVWSVIHPLKIHSTGLWYTNKEWKCDNYIETHEWLGLQSEETDAVLESLFVNSKFLMHQ